MDQTNESCLNNVVSVLEKNEDLLLSVLENLQLSRYSDCIKQYSILQSSLVSLSIELDNYPPSNIDPYDSLNTFPDEIIRNNTLDDLKPVEERTLPIPLLQKPCQRCYLNKKSDYECRISYQHVEPSHSFSDFERDEFLLVAKYLSQKFNEYKVTSKTVKKKYCRWDANELHTLSIAISHIGSRNYPLLSTALTDRTPDMVSLFIQNYNEASSHQQLYMIRYEEQYRSLSQNLCY